MITVKLLPNTYEGLIWGLTNFDGIETDIRLTKDNGLVIHHDPHLESGELISELSLEELEQRGIPTLARFLSFKQVVELSQTKRMYIELKPNCTGTKRIVTDIKQTFFEAFEKVVSKSEVNQEAINLISFCKDLLDPFASKYKCYPLLPDVNECSQSFVVLKAMPQILGRSLTTEIKRAKQRGFAGVFYARQYVMGLTSILHPSYEKSVKMAEDLGMLLGSNLGTLLI